MFPEIHIAHLEISSYALMAGVALIAIVFVSQALARRRGLAQYEFMSALIVMAVFAILGASLLYGITNIPYLQLVIARSSEFSSPFAFLHAIFLAFSGMVFYGGALGAILGMNIWARVSKKPLAEYLDLLAVGIPLFHAITRIGCFLGGCCYGIECDIGFVFIEDPIAAANGVTRFPVQLLESGCEAILFAVMLSLYLKRRFNGELIWVWLGSYAIVRFLDEFLRGDAYRGFLGPLSTSQWISLAILVAVVVHVIRRKRRLGYVAGSSEDTAAGAVS